MGYESPGFSAVNAMDDFLAKQSAQAMIQRQQALREQQDARAAQQQVITNQHAADALQLQRDRYSVAARDKQDAATQKKYDKMEIGDIPPEADMKEFQRLNLPLRFAPTPTASAFPPSSAIPNTGDPATAPMDAPDAIPQPAAGAYLGSQAQKDALVKKNDLQDVNAQLQNVAPNTPEARSLGIRLAGLQGRALTAAEISPPHTPSPLVGSFGEYLTSIAPGGDVNKLTTPQRDAARASWSAGGRKPAEAASTSTDPDGKALLEKIAGPAGFDMMVKGVAKGGPLPSLGMMTKDQKQVVLGRIYSRAAQYDLATDSFSDDPQHVAPDLASAKADFKANENALVKTQQTLSGVRSYADAAHRNAEVFDKMLKNMPDTGVAFLNTPWRDAKRAFGDENIKDFDVFNTSLNSEFAKIINNPTMASNGVLSDSARHEIGVILAKDSTVGQIRRSLTNLATESENRQKSLDAEVARLRGAIKGGGGTAKPESIGDKRKKYGY